ncbi:MAG: DUF2807 domain-containing protein [Aquisalinus sp.]|nr:DUF2807 domain-containing protein [Aquisalinus sp.]
MQKAALTLIAAMGIAASPAMAQESQDYDFTGFDRVSVASGYDAEISVGGDFSVRAETRKGGKLEWLNIGVDGSTLRITKNRSVNWNWSGPKTVVYITMPSLVDLDVSSGADAIATGIDAERFSVEASSGADAEVSGTCGRISADASSGSDIDAEDLICEIGDADASSGADISLHVTKELTADASSGADIVVYGGPDVVDSDTSSGGDVSLRR